VSRLVKFLVIPLALAGVCTPVASASGFQELQIAAFAAPYNVFSSSAGPICASGGFDFDLNKVVVTGVGNGSAFDFFGPKWNPQAWNHAPTMTVSGTNTLTCPNGSVTFAWHSVGDASDLTPPMMGHFKIVMSTGAYSGLQGEGTITWDSTPAGFEFILTGQVRIA